LRHKQSAASCHERIHAPQHGLLDHLVGERK
jgi:hypothetical protein